MLAPKIDLKNKGIPGIEEAGQGTYKHSMKLHVKDFKGRMFLH